MRFKDEEGMRDAEEVARWGIQRVLDNAFRDAKENDLVGIAVNHPALDSEIYVPFGSTDQSTVGRVMELIENVQQSKKELTFSEDMEIRVTRITPPSGKGKRHLSGGRFSELFSKYSSGHGSTFIPILNNDYLCFARSVVVAKNRVQYYDLGDASVPFKKICEGERRVKQNSLQTQLAFGLMREAGLLSMVDSQCGIPEFKKIQAVLRKEGFALKVFSYEFNDAIIFDDEIEEAIPLYIYHHQNHFTPMSSPTILTGTDFFCDSCNRGYFHVEEHRCQKRCSFCLGPQRCKSDGKKPIKCDSCHRLFPSQYCFEKHKKSVEEAVAGHSKKRGAKHRKIWRDSVCNRLRRCCDCGKTVRKPLLFPPSRHHCGQAYCSTCGVYFEKKSGQHLCYMQPLEYIHEFGQPRIKRSKRGEEEEIEEPFDDPDDIETWVRQAEVADGEQPLNDSFIRPGERGEENRKTPEKPSLFMFFDFECTQSEQIGENRLGPVYLHQPDYCVVRKVCSICKDFWLGDCLVGACKDMTCSECKKRIPVNCGCRGEHITYFSGLECKKQFCDFLFQSKHRNYIACAHNSKGYDSQFILTYLIEDQKRIPKIVAKGLKILSIECMGIRIIDSFSFLPQSLASLPKTFGESELHKGYFPHFFNKPENFGYKGPYPPPDMYGVSAMLPSARSKFFQWYTTVKDNLFDFNEELRLYTESDVWVLLRCILRFNDLFYQVTGIHPIQSSLTIAMSCNQVFRKNFLKPEMIGVRNIFYK